MNKDNGNEIFPLVDEQGNVIGSATRSECHSGSGLLHPVIHLHVFDSEGRLYLQRRTLWKDIKPGKWDTAVGGHIDYCEDTFCALLREAREELGLEDFEARFLRRYIFESERERELVNAYRTTISSTPTPSDELDGGRFWSRTEIINSIGNGVFTPNFESEYMMLFNSGQNKL